MHEVLVADGELSEQAETSMIIHRDLEVAIRQDNIIPYFQPIVNAKSGEIIGFEALARWPHPTLGIISPLILFRLQSKGN